MTDTLEDKLIHLFRMARDIHFEDGMESTFSRSLVALIEEHGKPIIQVLETMIMNGRVFMLDAGEALRWIGRMEHPTTRKRRRHLLERCLEHRSLAVVDGALLGIASMDDPKSIPAVYKALDRFAWYPVICEKITQVLDQLRETQGHRENDREEDIAP